MEEAVQAPPSLSELQSRIQVLKTHHLLTLETQEIIEGRLKEIALLSDHVTKDLFLNAIKLDIQSAEEKLKELNERQNLVATCLTQISTNSHILNALQHFNLGNYRRAISAAQKSIDAGQETNLAYKIMAMCYFKKNDTGRELIMRQNYGEVNAITEEQFSVFQSEVSAKLLHNKIKNDLDRALKYFRKKKYVKALEAAKECIENNIDVHFAQLLAALSLYHLKTHDAENLKEILTHLHHAKDFRATNAKLSTRETFAKEWAECLFNCFSLQIKDVAELIQKGLSANLNEAEKTETREKLHGLVSFDEENNPIKLQTERLGSYTSYQILKSLREQKTLTADDYIQRLEQLGVTKQDDKRLHEKIERQIARHDRLHPVKRAASLGAHAARQFFKAAREKHHVNAVLKFADEYRRSKITGPIDVVFHLIPHVIPVILNTIAFVAMSLFAGIRWALSPIIGKVIANKEENAANKNAVPLPVKLFKYEHVKNGQGLAFFAEATPPQPEKFLESSKVFINTSNQ